LVAQQAPSNLEPHTNKLPTYSTMADNAAMTTTAEAAVGECI
jgi:hypothetical protein